MEVVTPHDLQELAYVRAQCASGEARRIRLAAGLGLVEVGGAVGVSSQSVWRWERTRRTPTGAAALRYAALLRMLSREAVGA